MRASDGKIAVQDVRLKPRDWKDGTACSTAARVLISDSTVATRYSPDRTDVSDHDEGVTVTLTRPELFR